MAQCNRFRGTLRWMVGFLMIGAWSLISGCGQEGGQAGDLSKKAPPSLGAIANVDGSDEGKKEGQQQPAAGAEQNPAAGTTAPAAAPKP